MEGSGTWDAWGPCIPCSTMSAYTRRPWGPAEARC